MPKANCIELPSSDLAPGLKSAKVILERGEDFSDGTQSAAYNFHFHVVLNSGKEMTIDELREIGLKGSLGATGSVGYVQRNATQMLTQLCTLSKEELDARQVA
ncbi:MAG: hypothetical protein O2904_03230 [bacterium]|nr:hypothetical protein [bacterium]